MGSVPSELIRRMLHNHVTTDMALTGFRPEGECPACDFERRFNHD